MDIRENIIKSLRDGPMHVNALCRKFPNNKGTFTEIYKQMIADGELVPKKDGNKKILYLGVPKSMGSLNHIMGSLPLAEQRADKILTRLKKSKPLFIPYEVKDGEKIPMKLVPKNKRNLDKILELINDLVNRSVALTYAQCLDAFKPKSEKPIKRYHKDCINTIQNIMNKLEKQHKESELDLGAYLYYGINGYNHLTSLLFLAKRD